jgi:protein-L-isoaspartate O-methyltransferase
MLKMLNFENFEIIGLEHVEELIKQSKNKISTSCSLENISLINNDGRAGHADAGPYDFIFISGSKHIYIIFIIQVYIPLHLR